MHECRSHVISIHFISRQAIMASLMAASESLPFLEKLSQKIPITSLAGLLTGSLVGLGQGGHAIILQCL